MVTVSSALAKVSLDMPTEAMPLWLYWLTSSRDSPVSRFTEACMLAMGALCAVVAETVTFAGDIDNDRSLPPPPEVLPLPPPQAVRVPKRPISGRVARRTGSRNREGRLDLCRKACGTGMGYSLELYPSMRSAADVSLDSAVDVSANVRGKSSFAGIAAGGRARRLEAALRAGACAVSGSSLQQLSHAFELAGEAGDGLLDRKSVV